MALSHFYTSYKQGINWPFVPAYFLKDVRIANSLEDKESVSLQRTDLLNILHHVSTHIKKMMSSSGAKVDLLTGHKKFRSCKLRVPQLWLKPTTLEASIPLSLSYDLRGKKNCCKNDTHAIYYAVTGPFGYGPRDWYLLTGSQKTI